MLTRTLASFLILGLAASSLGCSGSETSTGGSGGGAGDGGSAHPSGGRGTGGGGAGSSDGGSSAGGGEAGGSGGGGATGYAPHFPRLGSYAIGNPQNYDSEAFRADAAKRHVVIVSQWQGWQSGRSMTMAAVMADIKQRSKVGTKLFVYVNQNEWTDPASGAGVPVWTKLDAEKWWLYPKSTSGAPTRSSWGQGFGEVNATAFSKPDADGKTWMVWKNEFDYGFIVAGDAHDEKNPSVDGFFLDNVFWKPRVAGDWNKDGTTESADSTDAAAWTREGEKIHFDHIRKIWPGSIQIGNVADWGGDDAVVGVLDQVLDGGVLEGMMGETWSTEHWGGFEQSMKAYAKIMKALGGDKLGIYGHDQWKDGDYQDMRHGLGACLLGDAYYYINGEGYDPSHLLWFDEFDFDLGAAKQPMQTAAWKDGVWRRDFDHGIVLVNPKGNGAKTVDLGGTFKHLTGTQDAKTNDGSSVTKVSLADRDGVILAR